MKAQHAARFGIYLSGWSCWRWALTGWGHRPLISTIHRQPRDRTGFCQPDLDRIPHSGCGTVRDQGAGRLIDLLQIVVSIVFTRFMALFQHTITCQSVLLPARNTEQSEKWRTVGGGWTAFVRSFPAISPAFLSVQKEQRFFCRMAKTLLFFKC